MAELTLESIKKMLEDERKLLLEEVVEKAEQRKKLMGAEEVKDYNFFRRRQSVTS